jgi:CTP:molybdopterin cytidylyltransferase MocA
MADDDRRKLAGIVLAAGGGTRFGAPKQLARLGGETLVHRAARLALGCCPAGVVVVTGAGADEVEAELSQLARMGVTPVRNPDWAGGMALSLASGLRALPGDAAAALVLLCDQAAVDAADLARLVEGWAAAPGRIAAAAFDGVRGVPAIFPRNTWALLQALRGDRGAAGVIAAQPEVSAVAMPHAALDVDTRADLDAMHGNNA